MPRDTELTMANKTAVAIPSAADFAEATVGAASIPVNAPRAGYVPVANLFFFARVKNVDATDAMTTGTYTVKLQFSTDSGGSWTDGQSLVIPAAELGVGQIAVRSAAFGRDFREEGVTDPATIRFRTRVFTSSHATASIVDTEVTTYLADKGAYGRSDA